MRRHQTDCAVSASGMLALWLIILPGLAWAAPPSGVSSPRKDTVSKYLEGCRGKAAKDANCEKLRKDAVEILKDSLMTLGSTVDRTHLPVIAGMFKSEEVDLRIAAADAIGMVGPQDSDVDMLAPLANDPVPDVRHAVANMLSHGKGNAIALLKQRTLPMRTGRIPEKPADPSTLGLPVAPNSSYLFDSSNASVGRLSYVTENMNEATAFYKGKAKKGPFQLQDFKEKYRYQLQDEDAATDMAQEAVGKQMENIKPPDPTNVQAFTEYMEKIQSAGVARGMRTLLDSYDPKLFVGPTVYILEERQVGQRSYPTRYVVLYQEQALRKPGYRLAWMTVPDDTIKTAQAASLAEEKGELTREKENAALKKREEALEALTKKKDEADKKKFKKGQADLEKELGF